jgi:hypothetical protein
VDEYHELMEMVENRDTDRFNTIQRELEKDIFDIRSGNLNHIYISIADLNPDWIRIQYESANLDPNS